MSWNIHGTGDMLLIQDGDRIVGSISKDVVDTWFVEILWSGAGGDITWQGHGYVSALAFVDGVEKTVAAFTATALAQP